MISPTGNGIRNDPAGAGHFHAPRSGRKHDGVDFLVTFQEGHKGVVYMPSTFGTLVRSHRPYKDDQVYTGVYIVGEDKGHPIAYYLFYLVPNPQLIGQTVMQGTPIGLAQDISQKYKHEDMQPHIHMRLDYVDPMALVVLP